PIATLFPYTTLFRSMAEPGGEAGRGTAHAFLAFQVQGAVGRAEAHAGEVVGNHPQPLDAVQVLVPPGRLVAVHAIQKLADAGVVDRKSTRLNSSHVK